MKAFAIPQVQTKLSTKIALSAVYLAIGLAAPVLGAHYQPITGPIVNATLFLAVATVGVTEAMLIGLFPSIVALAVGLLPTAIAPAIPFIMLSNTILVFTFNSLKKRPFWLGSICASVLKFLFLFATISVVTSLITQPTVAAKISTMFGIMQLVTALLGAALAFSILGLVSKRSK